MSSYDAKLQEIMVQEGDSIPAFFNAVFGFLSRYCPEKIYNSSQISGEHLINQSFCKWREKYLQDKLQKGKQSVELETPPVAAEEVVVTQNPEAVQNAENMAGPTENGSLVDSASSKKGKVDTGFNTTNGAVTDSYAWTQTIEDIEVRIPVPQNVKKGKQVKVQLEAFSLDVSIQDSSGGWNILVSSKLAYSIKSEESIWSLTPGEHILVNLEKKDERWWDRLLVDEDPINMQKIDAERDFSTLPQEEQEKIRELVWNKQQQEQGRPTSDKLKMESMLREAWNAEGSPFRGQAYDPSLVNFATGNSLGAG